MTYTVHHTHKNGVTYTVLHKDLANANAWFAQEGHSAAKELAQYQKGKSFHYFIEVSREVVDLEEDNHAN